VLGQQHVVVAQEGDVGPGFRLSNECDPLNSWNDLLECIASKSKVLKVA
jgi:hypothetical protein